jgi:hypothetical protein
MSALELEITDKVNAAMDEINNLTDKGGMPKEKEQDSNNA